MDNNMLKIKVRGTEKELELNYSLEALAKSVQKEDEPLIVAAKVNNKLRELSYKLEEDAEIEFIDLSYSDGVRIYQRSLSFIFIRAAMELFDGLHVNIAHSLSKGLFCEFNYERKITEEDLKKIKVRMDEIIGNKEVFHKEKLDIEEAREIFDKFGFKPKAELLKYRQHNMVNIYTCGWLKNYFYGYMVPDTSYITEFELKAYDEGVILRHPTRFSPFAIPEFEEHKKLAKVFRESEQWGKILGIGDVASLNKCIEDKEYSELMRVQEALHEKKVAQIADLITQEQKRLILIAGPSSSGKTTFANRLRIQLKVNGLDPITLSTDDYFVNREETPVDENGEYDFESIDAVNVELFNKDLAAILNGEEVDLPTFNFQVGQREYLGRKLKISGNQPIIIEGIHGLNEKLSQSIPRDDKFKIYISALTQLNIDDHNRIPTTDTRLIRRIARDSKFRGHSALKTLQLWKSVRRGEERNIFPFQEEADVMFNSAIVYELAILKKHVEPLLEEIGIEFKEYSEATRLLKFLGYFKTIEEDDLVPYTSILKEFIGGSCFTG